MDYNITNGDQPMGRHQPQWRLIDQTLDRVHAELIKHPAFTGTGGPNPGSVNYQVNWDKLERAGRILKSCLQNIKNAQGWLHVQSLAAKKIPREHRWSVNESLRARQGNLDYVQRKAQNLLEMLDDMVRNYGGPDLSSLNKLFDKAQDGVEELMSIISDEGHTPQPGYNAPAVPGIGQMPFHMVLAMIVFYIKYLRNRDKGGDA
ncbi:MAG: hypothetical protein AAFP68_15060 [Pseudomonadota bacterium]